MDGIGGVAGVAVGGVDVKWYRSSELDMLNKAIVSPFKYIEKKTKEKYLDQKITSLH